MLVKELGFMIVVKEAPQVRFKLEGIQRLLDLNKILHGPVSLKRVSLTSGEPTLDEAQVKDVLICPPPTGAC